MSGSNSQSFEDFAEKLVVDSNFIKRTSMASNDVEMLKIVKPFYNWTLPTLNNEYKKSSDKSMEYAEEAMEEGGFEEKGRSLKLANMITAFAEDAGDLALGHLVRYFLMQLFETEHHLRTEELELCVKSPQLPKKMNLDFKLDNDLGQEISPNFITRKEMIRIIKELGVERESPAFQKRQEEIEEQEVKKRKFTRRCFTLKNPNPKAPALEDFVKIKYDSVKGRYLVVTKDVPAGTTLLFDKPFVTGLAALDLEIERCHHCFKNKFTPIPNCVFVLYCSEQCFEESKEYHSKYECSVYPDLHTVIGALDIRFLCAYSTICTFGPQKIFAGVRRSLY